MHPAPANPGSRAPVIYHRPVLSLAESATGHAGADRCPGALAVHQAADGGLARIRVPGGSLPAPVFAALGDWSRELGNGRMELTGRGNLQLRGLRPGAEGELADRLAGHGLLPSPAHDRARNVLASPLSGRDGLGAWDVRPLVGELDRRLCAAPELADLPGRFLFALDDGRGDVAGLGADVTVLAQPGERAALLLAGLDTGLRPPAREVVDLLIAVAGEFLRARPDERVWRVAELPGGPLSLVSGMSPVCGVPAVRGVSPVPGVPAAPGVSPVPGPLSGPERTGRGPVGRFAQLDGRVAVGVGVPLGELTPERCRLLASGAVTDVVLTPWRGVLLPDLDAAAAHEVTARLAAAGLLVDADAPLLAVTACTGRPGCGKALADVRADALAGRPPGPPVHWSGCARRCGRPSGADVIDVVAEPGGYRVSRDGAPLGAGLERGAVRGVVPGRTDVPGATAGGQSAAGPVAAGQSAAGQSAAGPVPAGLASGGPTESVCSGSARPDVRDPAHSGRECAERRTQRFGGPGGEAGSGGPGGPGGDVGSGGPDASDGGAGLGSAARGAGTAAGLGSAARGAGTAAGLGSAARGAGTAAGLGSAARGAGTARDGERG